jgi:predicted AAA+ superfamily ATPase
LEFFRRVRDVDGNLIYNLEIMSRLTLIQGDSGTGKTTLMRIVAESTGAEAGIESSLPWDFLALPVLGEWAEIRKFVFIDEPNPFLRMVNLREIIENSSCYFVIASRDLALRLPGIANAFVLAVECGECKTLARRTKPFNQSILNYLMSFAEKRDMIWRERDEKEECKLQDRKSRQSDSAWIDRDMTEEIKSLHMPAVLSTSLHLGIWLQGSRHSGKTALLTKFGKDFYKSYYYLDLDDRDVRTKFEFKLKEAFSHHYPNSVPDYDKRYALAVIREIFPDFIDSSDRLLIIDEIQESQATYRKTRQIVRGLYSKVAFAGSYLGDIVYTEDCCNSASDVDAYDLQPVSYEEFLRASPIFNELASLDNFMPARKEDNRKLMELLKKLDVFYKAYATLGGYPRALSAFLQGESEKECIRLRNLASYEVVIEMAKRTGNPTELDKETAKFALKNEYSPWETVVMTIVDSIVKGFSDWRLDARVADVLKEKQDKGFLTQNKYGYEYSSIVGWMGACKILRTVGAYGDSDFKKFHTKYVFTNLGMLQFWEDQMLPIIADNPAMADDTKDIVGKYRGFIAENFASNALNDIVKKYQLGRLFSYDANDADVDFFIATPTSMRIAVKVKPSFEGTNSSEDLLKSGKFKYLIKFENRHPEWEPGSRVIVLPLYLIAMLPTALRRMLDENFEQLGPCGEYIQPEYNYRDALDEDTEYLDQVVAQMEKEEREQDRKKEQGQQ